MTIDEPITERSIAIVGAGSIGVAWAIVFARGGHSVRLFDPDPVRLGESPLELRGRLADLEAAKLITEAPATIAARVEVAATLVEAVSDAVHVQECAPEDLDTKRVVFADLDKLAPPDATLASSSSAIVCSAFASNLPGRSRCLIAHPGNPPYLLPIVELVPADFTDPAAVASTETLLRNVGMTPVVVTGEPEGFVFNRLQGALLREAYCLVRDGVISPTDLDLVVTEGPGRRWSIIGPFATADLNTRGGISAHAEKMGPAYRRMGAERGQNDPWTDDLVERVAEDLGRRLPPESWNENVRLRDLALMAVESMRRQTAETRPGSSSKVVGHELDDPPEPK